MAESIVKKLIDARDPDAVKLWADAVYQQLLAILGIDTAGATAAAGSAVIKAIQRGTITLSGANLTATATITAVDTTKTELRYLGQTVSADVENVNCYIELTNSTTITATRNTGSATTIVSWELTEYE